MNSVVNAKVCFTYVKRPGKIIDIRKPIGVLCATHFMTSLLKGQTSQRSYYCDDATGSEPPAKQPRPNHTAVMFLLGDCASQQATEDCNFDNYLNFPLT